MITAVLLIWVGVQLSMPPPYFILCTIEVLAKLTLCVINVIDDHWKGR
ncbi:MAG: hypothetical protein NC311_08860 [Muribaculaceae bacterium]|nr:hypothetical protein [Muribaculaceae bacterium]